MQKSPCLKCDLREESKSNPTCGDCQKRLDYVAGIGDDNSSVPIEFTDLTEKRTPIIRRRFTDEDDQFLRDNFETMTQKQIGEKLGRQGNLIGRRLKKLCLKKSPTTSQIKSIPEKSEIKTQNRDLKSSNQTDENKNHDFFILDFSDYHDLFEGLKQLAKNDFRTPENQVMYLIKKGVETCENHR